MTLKSCCDAIIRITKLSAGIAAYCSFKSIESGLLFRQSKLFGHRQTLTLQDNIQLWSL